MKLPRAVLLDLDDTILDDSGGSDRSWADSCATHRTLLGAIDPALLHAAIRRARAWYWSDPDRHREGRLRLHDARREVVVLALAELGSEDGDIARAIASTYAGMRHAAMRPFDGAVETVRWLRESGCRLALVTNGSGADQRDKIERFGLAELFDHVFIEGELGFGKPDPRVYRRALDALGTAPSEAWMVGDHLEWEVAVPKRLGLTAIWVDRHGSGVPAGCDPVPDRVIRSLAELRL